MRPKHKENAAELCVLSTLKKSLKNVLNNKLVLEQLNWQQLGNVATNNNNRKANPKSKWKKDKTISKKTENKFYFISVDF